MDPDSPLTHDSFSPVNYIGVVVWTISAVLLGVLGVVLFLRVVGVVGVDLDAIAYSGVVLAMAWLGGLHLSGW